MRAFVLDHVARHQVAAVRGGVEAPRCRAAPRCRRPAPPSATCSAGRRGEKDRSSQNRMKRASGAARSSSSSRPTEGRSSRCISTSFRSCPSARTAACTALTRLDLPMPRAPQSSALLAGRPRGELARVLPAACRATGRCRPAASSATRLTSATGSSRSGAACQTKASAAAKSGACAGARRQPLQRRGDPFQRVGHSRRLRRFLGHRVVVHALGRRPRPEPLGAQLLPRASSRPGATSWIEIS